MALLLSRTYFAMIMYPPPRKKDDTVHHAHEVIGVKFTRGIEAEASIDTAEQTLCRMVREKFKNYRFEVTRKDDGRMVMRLYVPTRGGINDFSGIAHQLVHIIRSVLIVNVSASETERDIIENTLSYVRK